MQSAPTPIDVGDLTVAPAPAAADERQAVRQALRDLEAARSRVERDAARIREETRHQLVAELLPVLDNLDRSIAAGASDDPMLQGVKQVHSQLAAVLRGYGLERFDAVGSRFDPGAHDAVAMVDVQEHARDGTVVHQLEAGYRSGERLLRPAKVAVGRYATAAQPQTAPAAPPAPRPSPVEQAHARLEVLRAQERAQLEALRARERALADQARRQAAARRAGVDPWDPWRGLRRR